MIPSKPFDSYKWRWLSVLPTEGLLNPPVLLGVLRVLARHEEEAPSVPAIRCELAIVERDTKTPVNLARDPKRNLIRHSGQYWKGTGLLAPDSGVIHLTSLGRKIAEGRVTQSEFAAIIVQQTVLPNPWTYEPAEVAKWQAAKLEIRPFALILEIIEELGRSYEDGKVSYLSPRELIEVVIPLAGQKTLAREIASYVARYRRNELDVSKWPDCAPESNDHRLAREFLLFLSNFGLCRKMDAKLALDEKYYLDELFDVAALTAPTTASIFTDDKSREAVVETVRNSMLPSIIERQRIITTSFKRSGQVKFRESILEAYCGRCLLSGEKIPEVLEAAHIIPIMHDGDDLLDNGICLRVDIHRLFDSGNIRIQPNGDLMFSDAVAASRNYNALPTNVTIPKFVKSANLQWRNAYL